MTVGPSDLGDVRRDRRTLVRELGDLDRAVYSAIADTSTTALDEPMRQLSIAANYSKLWIACGAGLAVFGGGRGRRTALAGLAAIGVTSAVVNQGVKRLLPRRRPDRDGEDVPVARQVQMPGSTSFPSGHSASGFAFATVVSTDFPAIGAAVRGLAALVAYSRVHTGVHYPGDVVIGSLIGGGIGSAVATAARRLS